MSRFALSINLDHVDESALIGLGGNVGDVCASMQFAIDTLHSNAQCRVTRISKVYKTPPWGVTDQDWFFNACAEVKTSLMPEALLDELLSIERLRGRVRDMRWGPRTLDLDLLVYGNSNVETERLTVPHPRMAERPFVIVPLMDIAPDRVVSGRTVSDYARKLDTSDIEIASEELTLPI
jgi:2-amino-4-hydroxy-6-hydroxymethyldihydropteridine diphosphokinase